MTKANSLSQRSEYSFPTGLALIIVVVLILSSILFFPSALSSPSSYTANTVILSLILLILGGGLAVYFLRQPSVDLFEIALPLTALFALHYPLRALFIVGWPKLAILPLNWPISSDYYIFQGLVISLIGLLFFYLGYLWKWKDKLCRVLPTISFREGVEKGFLTKTGIIYLVGIWAVIMLFRYGVAMRFVWDSVLIRRAVVSLLHFLEDLRYVGLFLAWGAWKRGLIHKLLVLAFLVVNLLLGVVTGSKNDVFVSILAVLFAFHYILEIPTKKLVWATVVLVAIFLGIFFPLVQSYRRSYLEVVGYEFAPTVDDIVETVTFLDVKDSGNVLSAILNRAIWLNSIVMIRRWVPEYIDYQRGATFYPLLIGWIPRAIWPGKPILSQGSFMHNKIIGSQTTSNVGFSAIGEFYLNFGMLGVIVGMFGLGIFVRIVYLYTQRFSPVAVYRALLYFLWFPGLLLSLQSDLATAILGLVRAFFLALIVTAFLSLGSHSRGTHLLRGAQKSCVSTADPRATRAHDL